jgi:hypothetical protein
MELLYKRNGPYPAIPIRDVNGRKLDRRLKQGLSDAHRALLALDLENGTACLHHLTRRQAKRLMGANQRIVASLRRASAEEQEKFKRGLLSLGELRARVPSDAAIDKLIAKLGPERVLMALDRITRPTLVAAE